MRPSFHILFLGWWLAGQWGTSSGQRFPKPSISVSPSPVVAQGGNVNILCKSEQYPEMEFYLYKEGLHRVRDGRRAEWLEVVFPILNANTEDGGIYWCQYHPPTDQSQWSAESDKIYINVTDPSLIKPSIKLQGDPVLGMNVANAIERQGPEHGLIFSLHNSRSLTAVQVVEPAGDTAYFPFCMLSLEDAGSYTCQYHHKGKPFIWSVPSDSVELILIDPSLPKPSIKAGLQDQYDSAVNFTIECQGPEKGLKFSLYKFGDQIASRMTEPDKTTAVFSFLRLRVEHAGSYTCQYNHRAHFFLLSKPSDPLQIVVRDHTSGEVSIRLGAAVSVLLVLVLIVAEAVYSWKRGQL